MSSPGSAVTVKGPKTWLDMQYSSASRNTSLNYPSPFLAFESIYIPQTVKECFELLTHAYLTDSNLKPAIDHMSMYPITNLIFSLPDDEDNPERTLPVKEAWKKMMNSKLKARQFNIKVGLDRNLYGNGFCSVYEPFERWLECTRCKEQHNMDIKTTKWRWKNMKFHVDCTVCKAEVEAKAVDVFLKNDKAAGKINLIRWSPYHLEIDENPISGSRDYYYLMPNDVRKKIVSGDEKHLREDPIDFIKAATSSIRSKAPVRVKFKPDKVHAMQLPMISMPGAQTNGWGLPGPIAGLRDIFFKNIMRRAQAMVLYEHIIPFRIVSPSMIEQPSKMMPMSLWKNEFEVNYYKWRNNPLHIMTAPIPINIQQMGGQGKSLSLIAEMEHNDESIIKALGIPRELVEGGLTYSGASVSIRLLENIFLGYVSDSEDMLNWLVEQVHEITGMEKVTVKYLPFKMADDVQLKQIFLQLYEGQVISGDKLGEIFDFVFPKEQRLRAKENQDSALYQAEAQAKGTLRMQKYQEQYMKNNPTPTDTVVNPVTPEDSQDMANQMQGMHPQMAQQMIEMLYKENPVLAQNLQSRLSLSPMGAQNSMMSLQGMDPQMAQQGTVDLAEHDPNRFAMMSGNMGQKEPVSAANGRKPGIRKAPMPTQKPPRSPLKNY